MKGLGMGNGGILGRILDTYATRRTSPPENANRRTSRDATIFIWRIVTLARTSRNRDCGQGGDSHCYT